VTRCTICFTLHRLLISMALLLPVSVLFVDISGSHILCWVCRVCWL